MLSISNLTYRIGGRALYETANLHVKPKDKIGLIGLNGTGKSTLLRIIDGEYQPDEGSVSKSKDCTIGFLNQDLLSYQTDESILSVAMQAFEAAQKVQQQIDKVLKQMETDYEDSLVDRLARLQDAFEALDGYNMQSKAEEILEGIGFRTEDLQRPLKTFSGGWRMRVMLAKLLLEKPSLLMLDEPTNHLDLPSIQWIEQYLRTYEGAVMVVSHDRQFLDNCVGMIVEVTQRQLVPYAGNYSFYLEEKELRNELQQNAYENQQAKIRQTERFIDRFRAKATKARQVQSRVKALERMDLIDEVVDENMKVNFKFTFSQQSGRFVSTMKGVSKAYGDLRILQHTDAQIEKGDKIALIGANGKGKSTLLRIIDGIEPIEGESKYGYNVIRAFYAQHQLEALTVKNEILEELKQAGSNKSETELRGILGCFLFSGDDVFKKISVLSGGEKSRVALAKTLLSEANFLLLDEPTNHLDMQSVNILIQALQQYEGSFITVSHDRHFVSHIANKIWWIEDQEIKEYPGTYDEYVWWQQQREEEAAKRSSAVQSNGKAKKKEKKVYKDEELKQLQNDLRRAKQALEKVEEAIEGLEQQQADFEAELAKPSVYGDVDKLAETNAAYEQVKKELEKKQEEWEAAAEKVEALEEEM